MLFLLNTSCLKFKSAEKRLKTCELEKVSQLIPMVTTLLFNVNNTLRMLFKEIISDFDL